MRVKLDEIQPDIFRIAIFSPDSIVSFNHFLIRDDQPALVHTGLRSLFPLVLEAVSKVIDPKNLRYFFFSHFEPDECGNLNQWFDIAPNSVACVNNICNMSMQDFADRPCQVLKDGDRITLGQHEIVLLETPHFPHNWEASLFFDSSTKSLFSSDLGTQKGFPQEGADRGVDLDEIVMLQKRLGYMPTGAEQARGIARIGQLDLSVMLPMHGNSLTRAESERLLGLLELENRTTLTSIISTERPTGPSVEISSALQPTKLDARSR